MSTGLDLCYDAFERLKTGSPDNKEFVDLLPRKITPSIVSQEAGFDPGYLKNSRIQHKPLISMIKLYVDENRERTTGTPTLLKREKKKAKKATDELKLVQARLDESLGRELQLFHRLKEVEERVVELESELEGYNNVSRIQCSN